MPVDGFDRCEFNAGGGDHYYMMFDLVAVEIAIDEFPIKSFIVHGKSANDAIG